ncbi:saccharopine dehydrogenase NADP-binding domain-containing protein [Cellulosimicrobium sp. PMB13]|uniref:saccharopine dehydrogenase family protein n=1 Tax=Cellulosimicrobium sp. PMB13 TaxID=3120158 RepID=UPI003F4B2571
MRQIVLLGATGYTGTLIAHELVRRGTRPLLAGRSPDRLASLADDLAGSTGPRLETAVADVDDPASVRALVERGDVLVSTVGPFVRHGAAAVEAAIDAGAVYLDSTGEPAFIREVVERYGPRARAAGTALLTAFGHDWVPGNVAGALALRDAGDAATRLSVGYFGSGGGGISGGTRASAALVVLQPSYAFRGGRLRAERVGARVVSFDLGRGRRVHGVSAGGTEPFTLPALAPGLRDVDVVIGARTPALRLVPAATAVLAGALHVPGVGAVVRRAVEARSTGSSGGPDAARRARSRSHVLADARGADGALLRRVRLDGPDPYDLTARLLAWGALRAAEGGVRDVGALGPVDAFGLDALLDALREAGVSIR